MNKNLSNNIIGSGYPLIHNQQGFFNSVRSEKQFLHSKLLLLLSTAKGQRIMNPSYGTNINSYLFQNLNDNAMRNMKRHLMESIKKWIPELRLKDIQIKKSNQDKIRIAIFYQIEEQLVDLTMEYTINND